MRVWAVYTRPQPSIGVSQRIMEILEWYGQCSWLQVALGPVVQCMSWECARDRVGRVRADGVVRENLGFLQGDAVRIAFAGFEIKVLVRSR